MVDFIAKPIDLLHLRRVLEDVPANAGHSVVHGSDEFEDIDLERIEMIKMAQDEDEPEPDLLAIVIDMFIDDAPKRIDAIEAAYVACDYALVEQEVHRFLSSCGNLGVRRMSEICVELEQQSRAHKFSAEPDLIEELKQINIRVTPMLLALK